MTVQIPELGIVIVATQLGRVAILALTKIRKTKELGFKIDHLLPTAEQEKNGDRPQQAPFLGIAAGPVPGSERSPHKGQNVLERKPWRSVDATRRYRLMLYYYDHTVLSYEISAARRAGRRTSDEIMVL